MWMDMVSPKVDLPEYPRDRRTVAFHEAGHAVVAYLLRLPMLSASVDREPHANGGFAGIVNMDFDKIKASAAAVADGDIPQSVMERAAIDIATMFVAGAMAELRLHGQDANGALDLDWPDFKNASTVLRKVFGSDAALHLCQRLASALLFEHWDWVGCVGNSIWWHGSVSLDEIARLRALCEEHPCRQ